MSKAINWIKDHKKAIIIGGVVVVAAACGGCYIYRYGVQHGSIDISKLRTKADFAGSVVIEGGIVDQARATVTRKRDYLIGKLNTLEQLGKNTSTDIDGIRKIDKLRTGIQNYDHMLEMYNKFESQYIDTTTYAE